MDDNTLPSDNLPELYSIAQPTVDRYGAHDYEPNANDVEFYRRSRAGTLTGFNNDPIGDVKNSEHPVVQLPEPPPSPPSTYVANIANRARLDDLSEITPTHTSDTWRYESSYYSEPTIFLH